MPKDTKTLGNNKARACESLGFGHKKGCVRVLTQPQAFYLSIHINKQKRSNSFFLLLIRQDSPPNHNANILHHFSCARAKP